MTLCGQMFLRGFLVCSASSTRPAATLGNEKGTPEPTLGAWGGSALPLGVLGPTPLLCLCKVLWGGLCSQAQADCTALLCWEDSAGIMLGLSKSCASGCGGTTLGSHLALVSLGVAYRSSLGQADSG